MKIGNKKNNGSSKGLLLFLVNGLMLRIRA